MKTKTKSFGKKKLAALVSVALAGTIALTGFSVPTVGASATTASEEEAGKWYTDFGSYEDEQKSAGELNEKIMEEGCVLLKNNNNTLPLKTEKKISLFGARSYDPVTGGTGSGGGGGNYVTLPDSLEAAGFEVNSKVKACYEANPNVAETGAEGYKAQTVENDISVLNSAQTSYRYYNDAAIITIARTGGEGADLYVQNLYSHSDKTEHYLELNDNEKALIEHVKANFDKVIILLNIANPMELGELQEDEGIDAILWIGQPGITGLNAVGRILNGEVNPSGRLVDIYASDFTKDPTWKNFGTLKQFNTIDPVTGEIIEGTDVYDTHVRYYNSAEKAVTTIKIDNPMFTAETIEYEEGIYLGYKYYETAAAEAAAGNYEGFDYDEEVVYPFGYGMSYTTFEQTLVTTAEQFETAVNNANGLDVKIPVQVKVRNTGDVAGKEVVQLYIHAPYTKGGIEKAEVALVGFAKTDMLAPGEEQVVTVEVRIGDIASFDYNDANKNSYKGWEIEAGDYELRLQNNSHETIENLAVTLDAKTEVLDNDGDSTNNTPLSMYNSANAEHGGYELFDSLLNVKSTQTVDGKTYGSNMVQMSRSDFAGTFPTTPEANGGLVYSEEVAKLLSLTNQEAGTSQTTGVDEYRYSAFYNSSDDKTTDLWYRTNEDIPEGWTQADEDDVKNRVDGKTAIQLRDMAGIDYLDESTAVTINDVEYDSGAAAWEAFMNQLTYDEMITILSNGGFGHAGLESIGKDQVKDNDGPAQLKPDGTYWCCEVVISSTWNTELAYEQGVHVGNESLFMGTAGWYGPGVNIHRSPFSGRNFEYYSQDGVQGGIMAAAVVSGAQSKGCNVYMKHFALNDQEDNRGGLATFATEQAIRENYLKVFEYCTKDGGATGVMSAFNRVGVMNEYNNYVTLNTILRDEWGFRGACVTDAYQNALAKANYMIRGGCDRPLGTYSGDNSITGEWDPSLRNGKGGVRDGNVGADGKMPESPTQWVAVRDCATRALWSSANTNANGNRLDKSVLSYDEEIVWYAGIDGGQTGIVPTSFAVDAEKYGTSDISYSVDGLPEGMQVNALGVLTGKSMELGSYDVTVNVVADGWAKNSAQAKLTIRSLYNSSDADCTAKAGEAYTTKLSQDMFIVNESWWDGGLVDGITYSVRDGAIPGLTLSPDGTLTGTPTTPGEYIMTVRTTLSYLRMRPRTANFDSVIKFVVTDAQGNVPETPDGSTTEGPEFRVEDGKLQYTTDGTTWVDVATGVGGEGVGISKIEKTKTEGLVDTYTITLTDGSTYTFTVTNGSNGAENAGGCSGSFESTAAIVGAALIATAAAVVVATSRRKRNK